MEWHTVCSLCVMPGELARAPRLSCSAPGGGLLLAISFDLLELLGLYRQYCWLAIVFAGVHKSPGDPCHLIGHGHTGLIHPNPRHQLPHPRTLGIGFVPDMANDRARPMHQQPSDIAVASLGAPAYTRRSAAAMLARDQPQPGRHLPARLKIMAMPQRRHKGRSAQGPKAFYLLQPLTRFHLVAEARELARDLGNPGVQRTQLPLQALQEVAHQER